jgi:hypothetical protein
VAACVILAGVGCGGGGVEQGATVSVFATAPLCAGAKSELARHGDQAGSVRVRVLCLAGDAGGRGRLDLAAIGADARRATEDSTTVGYIGETSERATRFTSPILGAAGIAQISGTSGRAALARLLAAIEAAGDAGNLREEVRKEIAGSS